MKDEFYVGKEITVIERKEKENDVFLVEIYDNNTYSMEENVIYGTVTSVRTEFGTNKRFMTFRPDNTIKYGEMYIAWLENNQYNYIKGNKIVNVLCYHILNHEKYDERFATSLVYTRKKYRPEKKKL